MAVVERRKAKFNGQELTILTDQLLAHKIELFGPHNRRAPARQRKVIWEDIRARVNAVASEFRDTEDLLKRWQDIKIKLRKDMAEHRRRMLGTGGGSPREPILEPYMRTALLILDPTTIQGFGTAEAGAESSDSDEAAGSQKTTAAPAPAPPRRTQPGAGTSAAARPSKRPASPTPPPVRAKVPTRCMAVSQPAAPVPAAGHAAPPPVPALRVAHKEMPAASTSSSSTTTTTSSDTTSDEEDTTLGDSAGPSQGEEPASPPQTPQSEEDSEGSGAAAPAPAAAPVPAPPAPDAGEVQQVLHDLLVAMGRMEAAKDNPTRHERDMLAGIRGLTAAVTEVATGQVLSELQHLSEIHIAALALAETVATAQGVAMAAHRQAEVDRQLQEAARRQEEDARRREEAAARHADSVATQDLLRALISCVSGLTAAIGQLSPAAPTTTSTPSVAGTQPPAAHAREAPPVLPPALGPPRSLRHLPGRRSREQPPADN